MNTKGVLSSNWCNRGLVIGSSPGLIMTDFLIASKALPIRKVVAGSGRERALWTKEMEDKYPRIVVCFKPLFLSSTT